MLSRVLLVLSFISVAFATVYVTNPTASTTDHGDASAMITWIDDGSPPSLATFGDSQIHVCAGGIFQQTPLQLVNGSVDVSTVSSINFIVNATIGPNSNKYFIRFQSLHGTNGTTPYQAFSAQFSLDNMTGNFTPAVLSQIAAQSTVPLGASSAASASPTSNPNPSLTTSTTPTGTSSKTAATAKSTSGAIGIKAGWAGLVFGAVVGVTMF